MPKKDIIDFLFDKQVDDDLFSLSDEVLESLDTKIEMTDNRINKFINKRVHPKSRSTLYSLLRQKEKSVLENSSRENRLFYRNGISDGISLMLIALSTK